MMVTVSLLITTYWCLTVSIITFGNSNNNLMMAAGWT